MKQLALLIGLALAWGGCEQKQDTLREVKEEKPTTITGQVFIVTKSRENVKLALVLVKAYDKATYRVADKKASTRRSEHLKNMKEKNEWVESETKRLQEAAALLGAAEYKLQPEVTALARVSQEISAGLRKRDGEFILAELNGPAVTEAKTDADGKFQLKLKPGEYYIVAATSRSVGKQEETYRWIVPQTVEKEDITLLLSNDNLDK